MRSTVELGSGKSCAKIIRIGIYLRILTGIHSSRHPSRPQLDGTAIQFSAR